MPLKNTYLAGGKQPVRLRFWTPIFDLMSDREIGCAFLNIHRPVNQEGFP